ncbi:hypothetical protein ACA910_007302 [Epithemia clementina (nom. ined.)]
MPETSRRRRKSRPWNSNVRTTHVRSTTTSSSTLTPNSSGQEEPGHEDDYVVVSATTETTHHVVRLVEALDLETLVQQDQEQYDYMIEFVMTDTGCGLPKHAMDHILDPYASNKLSEYRHQGGTGLGLSILTRLVHLLDGGLTVETRPGEGSRFTVHVPLHQASLVVHPVTQAAEAATTTTSSGGATTTTTKTTGSGSVGPNNKSTMSALSNEGNRMHEDKDSSTMSPLSRSSPRIAPNRWTIHQNPNATPTKTTNNNNNIKRIPNPTAFWRQQPQQQQQHQQQQQQQDRTSKHQNTCPSTCPHQYTPSPFNSSTSATTTSTTITPGNTSSTTPMARLVRFQPHDDDDVDKEEATRSPPTTTLTTPPLAQRQSTAAATTTMAETDLVKQQQHPHSSFPPPPPLVSTRTTTSLPKNASFPPSHSIKGRMIENNSKKYKITVSDIADAAAGGSGSTRTASGFPAQQQTSYSPHYYSRMMMTPRLPSSHIISHLTYTPFSKEDDDTPSVCVLIVDDNAVNRKILSRMLNCFGLDCVTVEDGLQAVELMMEQQQQQQLAAGSKPPTFSSCWSCE